MVDVKICGLLDEASLNAALAAGASHIGLVFFPKSPRHISLEHAAALAAHARDRARIVAVTVNADDALLSAIATEVHPDYVQLHGTENPARAAAARPFARRGLIKALPIAASDDLAAAAQFAAVCELFLFDAKPPAGAALPGGNGTAFDWAILNGLASPRPWFLSGGLTPANVAAAIAASGATAVDVSSGVESAPGVKHNAKIQAFIAAATDRPPPAHPPE